MRLCAYRPSMATAQIAGWVDDALAHLKDWHELREVNERTGEITTLAVIAERERVQQEGETAWTERVLVARSVRAQAGLRRRRGRMLGRVAEQLAALHRPVLTTYLIRTPDEVRRASTGGALTRLPGCTGCRPLRREGTDDARGRGEGADGTSAAPGRVRPC